MLSGDIIRDARLRAGLSQTELGLRVGRDRTQIARWERHAVAPSLETLRELVQACGYDLSLRLEPLDRSDDEVLRAALMLSPQERLQRMLKPTERIEEVSDFDPLAILGALERHRVAYVLVGDLAGVLHGTDLEATPSRSPHPSAGERGTAPARSRRAWRLAETRAVAALGS